MVVASRLKRRMLKKNRYILRLRKRTHTSNSGILECATPARLRAGIADLPDLSSRVAIASQTFCSAAISAALASTHAARKAASSPHCDALLIARMLGKDEAPAELAAPDREGKACAASFLAARNHKDALPARENRRRRPRSRIEQSSRPVRTTLRTRGLDDGGQERPTGAVLERRRQDAQLVIGPSELAEWPGRGRVFAQEGPLDEYEVRVRKRNRSGGSDRVPRGDATDLRLQSEGSRQEALARLARAPRFLPEQHRSAVVRVAIRCRDKTAPAPKRLFAADAETRVVDKGRADLRAVHPDATPAGGCSRARRPGQRPPSGAIRAPARRREQRSPTLRRHLARSRRTPSRSRSCRGEAHSVSSAICRVCWQQHHAPDPRNAALDHASAASSPLKKCS